MDEQERDARPEHLNKVAYTMDEQERDAPAEQATVLIGVGVIEDNLQTKTEVRKGWIETVSEPHLERVEEGKNNRLKIMAIGDGAVGKTCFHVKLFSGEFPAEYIPSVFDTERALVSAVLHMLLEHSLSSCVNSCCWFASLFAPCPLLNLTSYRISSNRRLLMAAAPA